MPGLEGADMGGDASGEGLERRIAESEWTVRELTNELEWARDESRDDNNPGGSPHRLATIGWKGNAP